MDFKPVQKVAVQFCVRLTCMSWVMLITDGSLTTTQRPNSSCQCKKKAHVHAWRRQIRSGAWPGVCSLFLFVCLLAFCFSTVNTVFYCNVLRPSKKNLWCKMWYLPLCINSIYMEKAGGFRPCLHSYSPPHTNLNSYSVILFPKTKLKWCCFVCLKNRMHPKCGNANDKNWNSTEWSKCSRRLRYFHYTSLISVRTYCDFTCYFSEVVRIE